MKIVQENVHVENNGNFNFHTVNFEYSVDITECIKKFRKNLKY